VTKTQIPKLVMTQALANNKRQQKAFQKVQ